MNKLCIGCNIEKPIELYAWNRSGLTRMARCPECVTLATRQRTADSRARKRGEGWQSKVVAQQPCSDEGHVCIVCKTIQPCSNYFPNKTFKYGHDSTCKSCKDSRRKARFAEHREKLDSGLAESRFRNDQITALRRNFNISAEQYESMLTQQNNVCALCEEPETRVSGHSGRAMNLAVDHDRRCCAGTKSCGNCVRGLLCTDCNTSLGKVECKPKLVEKFNLAQYVNNRPLADQDYK